MLKKCKSTRPSELTDAPSLELKVEVGFEGELSPVAAANFDWRAHLLFEAKILDYISDVAENAAGLLSPQLQDDK